MKQYGETKYKEYKLWFNQRLNDAIKAAEVDQNKPDVDSSPNRELNIAFFFFIFIPLHVENPTFDVIVMFL